MKPSFILHTDSLSVLSKLTTEQKGILLDAIYQYHLGKTVELDPLMDIVFTPFKNQFDRDFVKYLKVVERNRLNGQKGGRPKDVDIEDIVDNPDKPTKTQQNPSGLSKTQDNPNNLDSDNDSVNDNDKDSDSESKKDNDCLKGSDKPNPIPKQQKEKIDFDILLKFFNETFEKKSPFINQKIKSKYNALLAQGYTKKQIGEAMVNASKDQYHIDTGYKYCTLEFFTRSDKVDKFANLSEVKPKQSKPEEQRSLRAELK